MACSMSGTAILRRSGMKDAMTCCQASFSFGACFDVGPERFAARVLQPAVRLALSCPFGSSTPVVALVRQVETSRSPRTVAKPIPLRLK